MLRQPLEHDHHSQSLLGEPERDALDAPPGGPERDTLAAPPVEPERDALDAPRGEPEGTGPDVEVSQPYDLARAYEDALERLRELELTDEAVRTIASSLHFEEVYPAFASQVGKLVDFDRMTLVPNDPDTGEPLRAEVAGLDIALGEAPLEDAGPGGTAEPAESEIEPDLAASSARSLEDARLLQAGLRSGIRVPLMADGSAVGVLTLWSRLPESYGPRERRLLERLASGIAPAVANALLYRKAQRALEAESSTQEQMVRVERLRAMGELASGVAHDFNNSLAAILGRAQLLIIQVPDDLHLRSLRLIEKAALDSAQVVRRILDFARLDTEDRSASVDVAELLEDVVELTRHKWSDEALSSGRIIEVSAQPGDTLPVLGNYAGLREVLTNLVINACEAIPGDGAIDIGARAVGDRVQISVSDSGVGMSPEVIERVFEPFFTTKGSSGTGLGLSVAYGVISRHNGTIEVESEIGVGTTVRVSLPVAPISEKTQPVPAQVEIGARATASVLVIEDEPLIRETMADVLALEGYKVTLAADGEEGISLFRKGAYDIVFTDLGMPGLSGWDVARAIKRKQKDVPVVMVTGWGVAIDPSEIEGNGVDGILPKPFDIDSVLAIVSQLVGQEA